MPETKIKKSGAAQGLMLPSAAQNISVAQPLAQAMVAKDAQMPLSQNQMDRMPPSMYFVKAIQEGNQEAASQAYKNIYTTHGQDTASKFMWLAKDMQQSKFNDLAKNRLAAETDPQLKTLYRMAVENPNMLDNLQYFMPEKTTGAASGLLAKK